MYEWLKAFHVLMAVIWVGGAFTLQFLFSRLRKTDPQTMVRAALQSEWLGNHIFLPSSIILLGLGLWMVLGFELWDITDLWVLIGLGGIVATIITGAGFLGPESKRLSMAAQEKGVDDPQVQASIARIFAISRIDLVVLLIVVVDMVIKPGL